MSASTFRSPKAAGLPSAKLGRPDCSCSCPPWGHSRRLADAREGPLYAHLRKDEQWAAAAALGQTRARALPNS